MAKRTTLSTSARRALVASFVNQNLVTSQADLVELLSAEGIEVTQATASRDLEEVGAVRSRDVNGEFRYRFLDATNFATANLNRVSDSLARSIEVSANLVVVKTPAGGAQLLASSLDRASSKGELPHLIGTIAGDDTVLAIAKSATSGKVLAREIMDFLAKTHGTKRKGAH